MSSFVACTPGRLAQLLCIHSSTKSISLHSEESERRMSHRLEQQAPGCCRAKAREAKPAGEAEWVNHKARTGRDGEEKSC